MRAQLERLVGAVREIRSVGGGCISNASRVEAEGGTFFLKHAEGEAGRTFEAEARGLRALHTAAASTGLSVPEVVFAQDADGRVAGLLLLRWIEPGRTGRAYWERFGAALALMHRANAPERGAAGPWGFPADNFIGRLPQRNDWRERWPDFFRDCRLVPQFERARRGGVWNRAWDVNADRLLARLDALLPASAHPSVLHGDLWSGNHLPGADGTPWLVDPAAYVGHREADLAMTELFGGFDGRFYDAYRTAFPLETGYEERRDVYNLYHLVNHLNHFGGSYAHQVAAVLQRFS